MTSRFSTLSGKKSKTKARPPFFDLEITARCNMNCRHCYINLPAGDKQTEAQAREPL
jgi:MoaA/NifB/PqqE/SkfB family radical SAM enzyme